MSFFRTPESIREKRKLRLESIQHLLACPTCGDALEFSQASCDCKNCAAHFPIQDFRIYFVAPDGSKYEFDSLKDRLRNFIGPYYRTIVDIVAPDFPALRTRDIRKNFDLSKDIVIDCGSGSQRINDKLICLDFTDYEEVDIVCNITSRLPFADGVLDGSTSWGVIEHLSDPVALVHELHRCTKDGAKTVNMIAFTYPFHASPHDFFRYSDKGIALLFKGFEVTSISNPSGPISYLLLGIVEFASVILSFGNERLKGIVYLGLCALTFPIKLLDIPFINRKSFHGMAPCLVMVAKKIGGKTTSTNTPNS
jgi:hypothetical protein